jgi:hypothetical protein
MDISRQGWLRQLRGLQKGRISSAGPPERTIAVLGGATCSREDPFLK